MLPYDITVCSELSTHVYQTSLKFIERFQTLCPLIYWYLCNCSGLEDQLLGFVVAKERPDLEEAKNALIISSAKMRQELKEIEDKILYRLSNTEGAYIQCTCFCVVFMSLYIMYGVS